jgi:hypothetical protein
MSFCILAVPPSPSKRAGKEIVLTKFLLWGPGFIFLPKDKPEPFSKQLQDISPTPNESQ